MKKPIVFLLMIVVGLLAGPMSAQSKELAGSWVLDVEKSGTKEGPPAIVLALTDKEFTARLGSAQAPPMTFRTDGIESEIAPGRRGKASWKGNKLEATLMKDSGPESVMFSRDGAWLVVEARDENGQVKPFFFKKAPSGL